MLNKILASTYTKSDVLKCLRLLKDFVTLVMFSGADIQVSTLQEKFLNTDLAWLSSFFGGDPLKISKKELEQQFPGHDIYQNFTEAEEQIKKAPALVIYLPVVITREYLDLLGQNLRKSYGPKFLIEIKYDPSLSAGPALAWNGQYKDYSLRQKIADNKDQILKTVKVYEQ